MQTENEKAVRTLFEEWLAETQYAQDSESFHNELYSAWKSGRQSAERSQAALQSQSNTPQDGFMPDWMNYSAGYRDGVDAIADDLKQLCKDFSDLRDRPYMGDVTAQIDALVDRCKSEVPTPQDDLIALHGDGVLDSVSEEFRLQCVQQEQSGEAVKHCNKCGLGKREWAACDAPDCGELVASNSHAKPAAYYAGDLNGQLKDFRVALVDPELEIPLNTPFFLSPQFDASPAIPTATASQESATGQEAAAWLWRREYAGGGFSTELCNTKQQAEALLERFTEGGTFDSIQPLFLAPPTSTANAAMVIKQAADGCREKAVLNRGIRDQGTDRDHYYFFEGQAVACEELARWVDTLTPANAEAELEALMMRVAELRDQESAKGYMDAAYQVSDAAIVRRVLDEKGE